MKFKNTVVGYSDISMKQLQKENVKERMVSVLAHAIPVRIMGQAWMQKDYYKLRLLQGSETNVGQY